MTEKLDKKVILSLLGKADTRWFNRRPGVMQYREHLDLVEKKEQDPKSISFHELYRYIHHNGQAMTLEELVEKEGKYN